MKLKIKEVKKYEYNGCIYDTEEEIYEVYREDRITNLYRKIESTINTMSSALDINEDILRIIATTPQETIDILRKKINKINKEEK